MTERVHGVDRPGALVAVESLLRALGHDPTTDALKETPRRLVDALLEMTGGYDGDVAKHLGVQFENGGEDIVTVRDVPFVSLCEHHLLPFSGTAAIAYIPKGGKVVGLSKLARALDVFAMRLQLQERIGSQLADAMVTHLDSIGVAVVLDAQHGCLTCRGARKAGAVMRTSALRGVYRTDLAARMEVLALLGVK